MLDFKIVKTNNNMKRKRVFSAPRVLQEVEVCLEEALLVDSGAKVHDAIITGQEEEMMNNWNSTPWD